MNLMNFVDPLGNFCVEFPLPYATPFPLHSSSASKIKRRNNIYIWNKAIHSLISEVSVDVVKFVVFKSKHQETTDKQSFCFEMSSTQSTNRTIQSSFLLLTYSFPPFEM